MSGPTSSWHRANSSTIVGYVNKAINNVNKQILLSDAENLYRELLKTFNERNIETINEILDTIKKDLKDIIDGTIDLNFGGSVAKHTYVDGISDIDCLLKITNNSDLKPEDCLNTIYTTLKDKYDIKKGAMAITVNIKDIGEIQLVPALVKNNKLHVKEWDNNEWSKIDPNKFTDKLTTCNKNLNMNLVPTIKLAKSINSTLPKELQLSGYHIESLSINAFKNYKDSCTLAKMLPHLIKEISIGVKSQITDRTGQSRNVDDYLGDSNSDIRNKISHMYSGISDRINNISNIDELKQIIGENN